jgi:hypothetical protein
MILFEFNYTITRNKLRPGAISQRIPPQRNMPSPSEILTGFHGVNILRGKHGALLKGVKLSIFRNLWKYTKIS